MKMLWVNDSIQYVRNMQRFASYSLPPTAIKIADLKVGDRVKTTKGFLLGSGNKVIPAGMEGTVIKAAYSGVNVDFGPGLSGCFHSGSSLELVPKTTTKVPTGQGPKGFGVGDIVHRLNDAPSDPNKFGKKGTVATVLSGQLASKELKLKLRIEGRSDRDYFYSHPRHWELVKTVYVGPPPVRVANNDGRTHCFDPACGAPTREILLCTSRGNVCTKCGK